MLQAKWIIVLLSAGYVSAATYFVDNSGRDSNGGSQSSPWASTAKVNSTCLRPGDAVYFSRNQGFVGQLKLNSGCGESGTPASPIIIGAYGPGSWAWLWGGFEAWDKQGIVLQDLVFYNLYSLPQDGISIFDTRRNAAGFPLQFYRLTNVASIGFKGNGIVFGTWHPSAGGFRDVRISKSIVYRNGKTGILIQAYYSGVLDLHRNVYVGDNQVFWNGYNGIEVSGSAFGTIERNIVYENGAGSNGYAGPNGIITYDCWGMVLQYNESYRNQTSANDGNGIVLDRNTRNSTVQYNWTHENQGPGIYLNQWPTNAFGELAPGTDLYPDYHTGNTVRYNISQDDGRKNYGAFDIWGKVQNAEIYNNTIYFSPSGNNPAIAISNYGLPAYYKVNNVHLRNNIVQTAGGAGLIYADTSAITSSVVFQGNDYYSSGYSFGVSWGGYYGSLDSWRASTGQETSNGQPVGLDVNPGLSYPGSGWTVYNPDNLRSLTVYQLQAGSLVRDRGLNLPAYGINPGVVDFFGNSTPRGSAYDIGASEY